MKKLVFVFFFLLIISLNLLPSEKFPLTVWFWHTKDTLLEEDYDNLKRLEIKEVFIKAAHFWYYNQSWGADYFRPTLEDKLRNFPVHLTYTFSQYGPDNFYKHWKKYPEKGINYILKTVSYQIHLFKALGYQVRGVQYDLEGHIDFSLYRKLLQATKKRFSNLKLSIAVQPFWKKKKGFSKLLDLVDFYVLMLYDLSKPKNYKYYPKITDPEWVKKELEYFSRYKKDYWAGYPTYSYSLFYSPEGKLLYPWAPFRLESLSENKFFKLVDVYKSLVGARKGEKERGKLLREGNGRYSGEVVYVFKLLEDIKYNNLELKKGSIVKIVRVTPQALKTLKEQFLRVKNPYLKGICLFRFGAEWEKHILKSFQLLPRDSKKLHLELTYYPVDSSFILGLKTPLSLETNCSDYGGGLILFWKNQLPKNLFFAGNFDRFKVNSEDKKIVYYEKHLSPGEILYTPLFPKKLLPLKISVWIQLPADNRTLWSQKLEIEDSDKIKTYQLELK